MTRRMTALEAILSIYEVFESAPDNCNGGIVEAFIADWSADRAQRDMESYVSNLDASIDMDTITIRPDRIDGSDMDAFHITIKTREIE